MSASCQHSSANAEDGSRRSRVEHADGRSLRQSAHWHGLDATKRSRTDQEEASGSISDLRKVVSMLTRQTPSSSFCRLLTLLDRVLLLAQATPGREVLQEAIQHQVLDENRNWPFLQWDLTAKKMKAAAKKTLGLQTRKIMEELVELASRETELVRFKCLQPQDMEPTTSRVSPWLIQLSLCAESPPRAFATLSRELGLATDSGEDQTAPGQGLARCGAEQGISYPFQALTVMGWLSSLRLSDMGKKCYLNVVVASFLWCICQLRS